MQQFYLFQGSFLHFIALVNESKVVTFSFSFNQEFWLETKKTPAESTGKRLVGVENWSYTATLSLSITKLNY